MTRAEKKQTADKRVFNKDGGKQQKLNTVKGTRTPRGDLNKKKSPGWIFFFFRSYETLENVAGESVTLGSIVISAAAPKKQIYQLK